MGNGFHHYSEMHCYGRCVVTDYLGTRLTRDGQLQLLGVLSALTNRPTLKQLAQPELKCFRIQSRTMMSLEDVGVDLLEVFTV
ncbi:MAG: hypothetical protein GY820_40005 [Gammaproteobacteria bacterium]|nr:hypothetical protein [Gammaproteobacteria bacterium]